MMKTKMRDENQIIKSHLFCALPHSIRGASHPRWIGWRWCHCRRYCHGCRWRHGWHWRHGWRCYHDRRHGRWIACRIDCRCCIVFSWLVGWLCLLLLCCCFCRGKRAACVFNRCLPCICLMTRVSCKYLGIRHLII